MAGSLGDAYEKAAIDWMLGGAAPTRPTTLYLALYTAAAGETSGSGTEVTASNGYARQTITFNASIIGNGSNGFASGTTGTTSATAQTFTASGGPWGTIVGFAVYDALTGGNEVFYSTMDTSRVVNDGDTISFVAGKITFTLD